MVSEEGKGGLQSIFDDTGWGDVRGKSDFSSLWEVALKHGASMRGWVGLSRREGGKSARREAAMMSCPQRGKSWVAGAPRHQRSYTTAARAFLPATTRRGCIVSNGAEELANKTIDGENKSP